MTAVYIKFFIHVAEIWALMINGKEYILSFMSFNYCVFNVVVLKVNLLLSIAQSLNIEYLLSAEFAYYSWWFQVDVMVGFLKILWSKVFFLVQLKLSPFVMVENNIYDLLCRRLSDLYDVHYKAQSSANIAVCINGSFGNDLTIK